jgi:hypothetical protein
MQKYLEFASPVQPTVQRVDGIPTLERHELGANLCTNANFKDNNNKTEGSLYSGQDYGTQWKFYSPVFISNQDWKQAFGFTYHLPYPPYSNTTSLWVVFTCGKTHQPHPPQVAVRLQLCM